MDYLSGKSKKPTSTAKKTNRTIIKTNSKLEKFIDTAINMYTPDQRAWLYHKFISSEILEVLKDDELYVCIDAFFRNDLNLAETSRNAFLYRNTLLYRIDKIQKLTGLNIRKFDDAMLFLLYCKIYNKMNY